MEKNTFKGFVFGKTSQFKNGAAGNLLRLTQMYNPATQQFESILDGEGQPSSLVVDLVQSQAVFNALYATGFGPNAIVAFEADGWFEWDVDNDNFLEAKGSYPETPIHRLSGVVSDSIVVVRKVRVLANLGDREPVAEPAQPGILQRMANKLSGKKVEAKTETAKAPKPRAKVTAKA